MKHKNNKNKKIKFKLLNEKNITKDIKIKFLFLDKKSNYGS